MMKETYKIYNDDCTAFIEFNTRRERDEWWDLWGFFVPRRGLDHVVKKLGGLKLKSVIQPIIIAYRNKFGDSDDQVFKFDTFEGYWELVRYINDMYELQYFEAYESYYQDQ
jgi:hypothetical protein